MALSLLFSHLTPPGILHPVPHLTSADLFLYLSLFLRLTWDQFYHLPISSF